MGWKAQWAAGSAWVAAASVAAMIVVNVNRRGGVGGMGRGMR
jgi:hypothetical protein